jgi:hypothetical protein
MPGTQPHSRRQRCVRGIAARYNGLSLFVVLLSTLSVTRGLKILSGKSQKPTIHKF